METQDRQAIENLFGRLEEVERQAPPRDAESERFIKDRVARQPAAPYFMAQTIVMQELALQEAQRRIEELERGGPERKSEGLFSGIFGGGQTARRMGAVPSVPRAPASAQTGMAQAQPGRGGFLAGAAQTAMGVAGGLLLGNFIGGMLGGNDAQAAEASPEEDAQPNAEPAADDGGDGLFDGSFDGGDMDI